MDPRSPPPSSSAGDCGGSCTTVPSRPTALGFEVVPAEVSTAGPGGTEVASSKSQLLISSSGGHGPARYPTRIPPRRSPAASCCRSDPGHSHAGRLSSSTLGDHLRTRHRAAAGRRHGRCSNYRYSGVWCLLYLTRGPPIMGGLVLSRCIRGVSSLSRELEFSGGAV